MTQKKVFRIDTVYRKELEWLRWYYRRDSRNPKRTILEQHIADRIETLESPYHATDANGTIKRNGNGRKSEAERVLVAKENDTKLSKYLTIKRALDDITERTDAPLLTAIKEVYVYRSINLIGAASRYMFVSERTAYYRVKEWLEEFSDELFNPRHRSD